MGAGVTAGSTGSESTCEAILRACAQLRERLKPHAEERGSAEDTWKAAVRGLKSSGTGALAAVGFSDSKTSVEGSSERVPMRYNVFGAACTEVEVDLLTGEKTILRSDILYDCGSSLNPAIDVGQVGNPASGLLGSSRSFSHILANACLSWSGAVLPCIWWQHNVNASICMTVTSLATCNLKPLWDPCGCKHEPGEHYCIKSIFCQQLIQH